MSVLETEYSAKYTRIQKKDKLSSVPSGIKRSGHLGSSHFREKYSLKIQMLMPPYKSSYLHFVLEVWLFFGALKGEMTP